MSEFNERSKRQIALLAGDDLEGVSAEEARRSIEACPKCRGHWTRVRGCLDLMERAGKECPEPADGVSLWPALEARLSRPVVLRAERFNGWVPALSMAAACVALMIAGQLETLPPQDSLDGGFPVGGSAAASMVSLARNPVEIPEQSDRPSAEERTPDPFLDQQAVRGLLFPYEDPVLVSPFGYDPR